MEPKTETHVDKSAWPDGPWKTEPDRVEWRHGKTPCLIVRGPMGSLCGYAAVAPGHALHGVRLDDGSGDADISVHGGITFASRCSGHICHVAEPGEPDDVWWFGFDAAHYDDLSPHWLTPSIVIPGSAYRDLAWMRAEVERLAEQLEAL